MGSNLLTLGTDKQKISSIADWEENARLLMDFFILGRTFASQSAREKIFSLSVPVYL